MRTTKAYLAGLGMTGIVIGSILILLVIGTGLVAFDGVPNFWAAKDPLERVVVEDEPGGGAGNARAGQAGLLAAAGRYPPATRSLAAERRQGAARRGPARRRAAHRRAVEGHGGAVAGDRLGGGAGAGMGRGIGDGALPGGSRGPSGGQPALPGSGDPSETPGGGGGGGAPGGDSGESGGGGGAVLPLPIDDMGGGVSDTLGGVVDGATGTLGGTVDRVVSPVPLR
jgi:hypothetical protein